MRNIIKKGKKEIKSFKCGCCGEEWETDEYFLSEDGLLMNICENCMEYAEIPKEKKNGIVPKNCESCKSCKNCKEKITGYGYRFNEGYYCENCKEIGALIQDMNLLINKWLEYANRTT